MARITKWLLLLLFVNFIFIADGWAQTTYPAASCNESDVAAAIASATTGGSGNIVTVPAGKCIWTTSLTTPASGSLPSITIIGAGNKGCPASCDDATIIESNGSGLWYIVAQSGTTVRLSGITIENSGAVTNGVVKVEGPSTGAAPQVRLDHIHGNVGLDTTFDIASVVGVIDHSLFDQTASSEANAIRFYYPLNGDSGDGSWNKVTGLGTSGFIFVENCVFNHGVANDGQEGARFVFRYDTFNDTSVQTHPTGGDGRGRGARAWEVYNNTFTATTTCMIECGNAFWLSSGTGLVWGNTANNAYSNFINVHSMRVDNSTYTQSASPNGWGYCGTNFDGTGSNWDNNTNAANGYACLDQPGRGVGDLIQGAFPNACDVTSGACAAHNYAGSWPNEALEPVYEWLNTWGGSTSTYWPVSGQASTCSTQCSGGSVLQSNRDYYLWCNPSSTNGCISSFTGASGTGSGTIAARPATCTPMVAYWATDTTTLYQCSSTNTWTVYYQPYTYPHPLTNSPAAPTGLTATVQ